MPIAAVGFGWAAGCAGGRAASEPAVGPAATHPLQPGASAVVVAVDRAEVGEGWPPADRFDRVPSPAGEGDGGVRYQARAPGGAEIVLLPVAPSALADGLAAHRVDGAVASPSARLFEPATRAALRERGFAIEARPSGQAWVVRRAPQAPPLGDAVRAGARGRDRACRAVYRWSAGDPSPCRLPEVAGEEAPRGPLAVFTFGPAAGGSGLLEAFGWERSTDVLAPRLERWAVSDLPACAATATDCDVVLLWEVMEWRVWRWPLASGPWWVSFDGVPPDAPRP